uniref:Uncharacterized protein n=1 Tax=Fervidobacterium thailandense TaxID=1008305 RepID=A0A7C4W2N9_9BACT
MSEEKSFIYMLDRIFKRLAAEPNKFEHFLANSLASYGLDDLNRYTLEQIPVSHVPDCVRDRLRSPVDYLLEKKLTKDGIFT